MYPHARSGCVNIDLVILEGQRVICCHQIKISLEDGRGEKLSMPNSRGTA